MTSALQSIDSSPTEDNGERSESPLAPVPVGSHEPSPEAQATDAEKRMVHLMVVSTLAAIPVFCAFWMGLVAIAISFTDEGYAAPLAMSLAIGVLSGLFWGTWMGFITYAHGQEIERKAQHAVSRAAG